MRIRPAISLLLLALNSLLSLAQSQQDAEAVRKLIREYGQAEVMVLNPGSELTNTLVKDFSVSKADPGKIILRLSPLTAGQFIDLGVPFTIIPLNASKGIASAAEMSEVPGWDKYPAYTQYDSIMRSFTVLYPSLCHLDTIGTTNYGKLVLVLKISDNHAADEDEPEVFYTSSIHGDETGGFILMLRLCEYILSNYSSSQRIRNLVDGLEIWINPLANPDGMYLTGNTITNPVRFNSKGYDLNRNFPDPLVSVSTRQKETLDMMKFLAERKFVLSANFHSGSEVVNYPWDRWLEKIHADDLWFYLLSRAYADTVHSYSVPGYMTDLNNGVTRGAVWYVITGGRQDYVTWELHGREVTIELDDDYITPVSQLESLWQWNYRSLLGYIESALFGIQGYTEDFYTGTPVPARITIAGYDKDNSEVYSDSITGRFTRLVDPRSWALTFSASGYLDTTIANIPVFAGQRTDLTVKMVPLVNAIDTTNPASPVLYPNPVKGTLKAVLPGEFYGPVNVRIFNTSGRLVADYDDESARGMPLMINAGNFGQGIYTVIFRSRYTGSSSRGRFVVVR